MIKPRIIIGSYMFRYPLGGMLSWVLQYLTGFKKLGFDVFFVEKYGYPNSCYDPIKEVMSDDCSYGLKLVSQLLDKHGLENKWCYMDRWNQYHGLSKNKINSIFETAQLFIDMGTHGAWMEEASTSKMTLLLDGEPGFTQIKMANSLAGGEKLPQYDFYYTNGCNIGAIGNPVPTLGLNWRHVWHPVDLKLFKKSMPPQKTRFTTIMNWKSHDQIKYAGKTFGQKDVEFLKFADLPKKVTPEMIIALSGKNLPLHWLLENGWIINSGKEVTKTFKTFSSYISQSSGEFSICKNVFVENQTGWFSDKSAAYLGSYKPVILQDTGFSKSLPCGEGLFAFSTVEEAKYAIEEVSSNYNKHSRCAFEIAYEFLSTEKVLTKLVKEVGL